MGHNINGVEINERALAEFKKKHTAKWEDCSNGWMCSKCCRDSTYDYNKCPHCGRTMTNGTIH